MARTTEMPSLCHSSCVICHAEPNSPAASLELAPPSDCLRSQALDPPANAGAECPVLQRFTIGLHARISAPSPFSPAEGVRYRRFSHDWGWDPNITHLV